MPRDDRRQIARDSYLAFAAGDRSFFKDRLSDALIVSYVLRRPDGNGGQNTEILTFDADDKIVRIEVYFGWNLS
jgi:hypothetical protein